MSETVETAPPVESAAIDVAPAVAEPPAQEVTATTPPETPPAQEHAAPVSPAPDEPTSDLSFEQAPVAEPVAPVAPTYEFQIPEGRQVEPAQMQAFTELAGKHMLPPETAQELLNQHLAIVQGMEAEYTARATAHWDNLKEELKAQAAADPEYGGAAYPASVKSMIAGRDVLVPAANAVGFDNLLKTFPGLDVHPEFRRMLFHAGQRWAADQQMKGTMNARLNPVPQKNPEQDRIATLYPTMTAQKQRFG
jgi:hypothetical protein